MSTKTPAQAAEEEYPHFDPLTLPFTNKMNEDCRIAFAKGAEWQASQAPPPSLTVEKVMEVVKAWTDHHLDTDLSEDGLMNIDLRFRLSKLFDPQ